MRIVTRFMQAVAYLLDRAGLKRWSWNLRFSFGKSYGSASPRLAELISRLARGGLIVEHGCGRGALPSQLADGTFSAYIGYDLSDKAILMARRDFPMWRFARMSAEDWTGEDVPVDVVVAREFVNYLNPEALRRFLAISLRSLRPGGKVIITLHDRFKHASTVAVCKEFPIAEERIISRGIVIILSRDRPEEQS